MSSRVVSSVVALCLLLFAVGAQCKSLDKRNAPGANAGSNAGSNAGDGAADDPENAGERDGVIILKGIYTCPEVEDESQMFGVVKEINLQREEATKYAASGAIQQVHSIICEDTFAMNFTLLKLDSNNNNLETTMVQFDAANVTKLIGDHPDEAEPFFSVSNFPRTCPFNEDYYSVKKYFFDIAPYRKYLPEAGYKMKLIGTVNSKMIWCTILEFEVQVDD